MNDGFQMQLFGGQSRKASAQVKTHLMSKHGERAGAGSIFSLYALVKHTIKEFEILLHAGIVADSLITLQSVFTSTCYFAVKNVIALGSVYRLWRYTDFVINHADPGAVPGASTIFCQFMGANQDRRGRKGCIRRSAWYHRYRSIMIVANDNYAEVAVAA